MIFYFLKPTLCGFASLREFFLHQLNNEQLDQLGAALLNIKSPQKLQAWLNNGAMQESH